MNGSGTPINHPKMVLEHLKADIRGTTWCGLKYDVLTVRETPRSGKPECHECRAIEDGDAPIKTPPPLFRGR